MFTNYPYRDIYFSEYTRCHTEKELKIQRRLEADYLRRR